MAHLTVTRGDGTFTVEVRDGGRTTTHDVTVAPGLAEGLGWPPGDEEGLVRASFAFLLEREPSTSILRRFDLEVIERYFPEYRRVVTGRRPPGGDRTGADGG